MTTTISGGSSSGAVTIPAMMAQCRLVKNGSNLELRRHNGKYLFINGANEVIPATAPTLAAPATDGTLYYIYAYMSGSTLTLEASTTAYAEDSTYGHKIKSGDATRSLVGMARTVSSAWADSTSHIFVRSWFNRAAKRGYQQITGATTTSGSVVEMDSSKQIHALLWDDEAVIHLAQGKMLIATGGASTPTSARYIDGAAADSDGNATPANTSGGNNWQYNHSSGGVSKLSEGYHYFSLRFQSDGTNTLTAYMAHTLAIVGG